MHQRLGDKSSYSNMASLQVFLSLLSILTFARGQTMTYYVTPSSDDDLCPFTPCFTLSYFATNPDQYFVSGATFVFLPGEHQLGNDGFVVIRDVADLSLVGSENASIQYLGEYLHTLEPNAMIYCTGGGSGFVFINVSNLHISDLGFELCGAVIPPDLATEALTVQTTSSFSIPNNTLKSALLLVKVHSLDMNAVLVSHSFGYGLLAINTIGEVLIQKCSFWLNNYYVTLSHDCRFPKDDPDIHNCVGGNARFIYSDPSECPTSAETYTVVIHQSVFVGGVDYHGSYLSTYIINRGSGFGVTFAQRMFGVRLLLSDVYIYGNTGAEGANLYIASYNQVENSSVSIHNCLISDGNRLFPATFLLNESQTFQTGAGMYFKHGLLDNVNRHGRSLICEGFNFRGDAAQEILAIHNSKFDSNVAILGGLGAGMLLSILPHANVELKRTITINGVQISNNVGLTGTGLWLADYLANPQLDVTISNSIFSSNKLLLPIERLLTLDFNYIGAYKYLQLGTVGLNGASNVTICNCRFFENGVSAISAFNSKINFGGRVQISNNKGSNGGALTLFGDSVLYLLPHLHMSFTDYFAFRRGGAIYVDSHLHDQCFFQVTDPTFLPTSQLDISLRFSNNNALEAGDILYGGGIDDCTTTALSGFRYEDISSGEIFDALTDITQEDSNSLISSDPDGACFCEGDKPDCENSSRSIDLFPGQSFQVPLMAIGQRNGVLPAVMRAYFVAPTAAQFRPLQEIQDTGRHCVNLTYTVSTNNDTETIRFIPHESLFIHAPEIAINVLPCPVGFQLAEEQGICSCSQALQVRHVTCDIEDETVTRATPYWFSAASGELAFHDHCPFDYCRDESVEMNLAEPDTQCAFQRSGTLCGECRNGHSLSLGTSKCQKCTNVYLLLIIPFAIMGVLLVLFLSLLNLTVKVGTIHGLIFYANVVKINQAAFFPSGEVSFFTVFLSWLNLDFGIESCFYDGLNAYTKTWLQFAFPIFG